MINCVGTVLGKRQIWILLGSKFLWTDNSFQDGKRNFEPKKRFHLCPWECPRYLEFDIKIVKEWWYRRLLLTVLLDWNLLDTFHSEAPGHCLLIYLEAHAKSHKSMCFGWIDTMQLLDTDRSAISIFSWRQSALYVKHTENSIKGVSCSCHRAGNEHNSNGGCCPTLLPCQWMPSAPHPTPRIWH